MEQNSIEELMKFFAEGASYSGSKPFSIEYRVGEDRVLITGTYDFEVSSLKPSSGGDAEQSSSLNKKFYRDKTVSFSFNKMEGTLGLFVDKTIIIDDYSSKHFYEAGVVFGTKMMRVEMQVLQVLGIVNDTI